MRERSAPRSEAEGWQAAAGELYGGGRTAAPLEWQLADEVPVALAYNGRSHAVLMATPADLADLGLGFSLSEGIVAAAAEVRGLRVVAAGIGKGVAMTVPAERAEALAGRRRAMEARSSCGICGVETLEELVRPTDPVRASVAIPPAAIAAALAALPAHQPLNRLCRSVHAAAWCGPDGAIALAREDVGRHNALDKLIGALAGAGTDFAAGFVAMSSRCSFELVQKAAVVGIPLLATVSAPTTLALTVARRAGITLAAAAADGAVALFR